MPAKQCDSNNRPEQRPNEPATVNRWFHRFACKTSDVVGSPWSFFIAIGTIVAWGVTGPIFHYSDTWQLIINTSTTIVTFLMVFLIQNTQNRDAKTFHLKLDELIHAIKGARNKMIDLENMTDEELERIRNEFQRLSRHREQQASQEHGPANGRKQQATR